MKPSPRNPLSFPGMFLNRFTTSRVLYNTSIRFTRVLLHMCVCFPSGFLSCRRSLFSSPLPRTPHDQSITHTQVSKTGGPGVDMCACVSERQFEKVYSVCASCRLVVCFPRKDPSGARKLHARNRSAWDTSHGKKEALLLSIYVRHNRTPDYTL